MSFLTYVILLWVLQVRPINIDDFETALDLVKPSVDPADLAMYEEFDKSFGCQVVKPKVPEV